MRSKTSWIASAALLAGLLAQGAPAQVVIGVVVSKSGMYAELAASYGNGLAVWQEEVNAAGGLLGQRVELKLLDDASDSVAAARLYEQLVREGAQLLIGPYGSAATVGAAAVAERARRVLVNGAGPARVVERKPLQYVFPSTPLYAVYGEGIAQLAHKAGARSVVVLARDDAAAREMAEGMRASALKLGLKADEVEVHGASSSDFGPQVARARAAQADAWIAFGGPREAAEMVKTLRRLDYAPKLFFASGVADPQFVRLVGQDAEGALGASVYESGYRTTGNERFAALYAAKWGVDPGLPAALGFAAGQLLAQAVRRAGSLDQEALRKALDTLTPATVLAAPPVVLQIQEGRRIPLWPPALASGLPLAPYLPWGERKVLK